MHCVIPPMRHNSAPAYLGPFILIHIIIGQIHCLPGIFADFKVGITHRHPGKIRILLLPALDQGNQFGGIFHLVTGFRGENYAELIAPKTLDLGIKVKDHPQDLPDFLQIVIPISMPFGIIDDLKIIDVDHKKNGGPF